MDGNQSLFDRAYEAAHRRDDETARSLLSQLLKQEPNHLNGWLLASHVMKTRSDAIKCLERALQIDPGNEHAVKQLAKLRDNAPAPSSVAPAPPHRQAGIPPDRAPQPTHAAETPATPTPASNPKSSNTSSRNNITLIFIGLIAALCCLLLAGIVAISPNGPFSSAVPTPSTDDLFSVLYRNANAATNENLTAYMATIHSNSPLYSQTETALREIFPQYDLQYQFYNLELTSLNSNEAQIHFKLSTRRIRGPAFRDNIVTGTMILRPDNDVWKIYNQTVENVQYE